MFYSPKFSGSFLFLKDYSVQRIRTCLRSIYFNCGSMPALVGYTEGWHILWTTWREFFTVLYLNTVPTVLYTWLQVMIGQRDIPPESSAFIYTLDPWAVEKRRVRECGVQSSSFLPTLLRDEWLNTFVNGKLFYVWVPRNYVGRVPWHKGRDWGGGLILIVPFLDLLQRSGWGCHELVSVCRELVCMCRFWGDWVS